MRPNATKAQVIAHRGCRCGRSRAASRRTPRSQTAAACCRPPAQHWRPRWPPWSGPARPRCPPTCEVCVRAYVRTRCLCNVRPPFLKQAQTHKVKMKVNHLHDDHVDFSAQKHIARNLPIERILCLELVKEEINSHHAAHQQHRLEINRQRRWLFATCIWFMHPVPVPGTHVIMHQITQSSISTMLLLRATAKC